MRINIKRKNSTSAERRVYEVLKRLKVPFKHRVKIWGMEIDFLIGKYALEIDGHIQDTLKNEKLAQMNLVPLHLSNLETRNEILLINLIKKLC